MSAMHPWWPHLFSWPRFLDPLSWWWLSRPGYAFTSSGLQLTIPIAFGTYLWKHNCHEHRCWRLCWHEDAEGHPVCKVHHPDHPARGWFRFDRSHPRHAKNARGAAPLAQSERSAD